MSENKKKNTSPSLLKKVTTNFKKNNEKGAKKAVLEELFNDFNRSRAEVYKMNFFRGIFFATGTVLGGTIVIALIVFILSLLGHVFPPFGGFFNGVSNTIDAGKK